MNSPTEVPRASVVHQNINLSKLLDRSADNVTSMPLIRHRPGNWECLAVVFRNIGRNPLKLRVSSSRDDDRRTFLRKQLGYRFPYPGIAPRHNRHLSGQSTHSS
jgi:hypothetical protein